MPPSISTAPTAERSTKQSDHRTFMTLPAPDTATTNTEPLLPCTHASTRPADVKPFAEMKSVRLRTIANDCGSNNTWYTTPIYLLKRSPFILPQALVMVLSPSTIARAYAGLSACALWNTLILSAFQDVGEWRMVYYWAHIAGKVVFAGLAGFLVKYRVQEFVVSGEYGDLVSTVLEAAMAVGYLVLEATTSEWSQGADIKKQLGIRS